MKELRTVTNQDPLLQWWYNSVHAVSRYFDATLHDTDRLPATGRVMVVGNHALMGIDAWALLPELYRCSQRVPRGMGLRSLFKVPVFAGLLEELGMVAGSREAALELLEREEMVVTYPGGARDSLRGKSERYKLRWGGRRGYAHVAIDAGAPVLPIAGVGPDDAFPILNDSGLLPMKGLSSSGKLRVPLFLPIARPVPFDFFFGEPLAPPELPGGAAPELKEEAAADFDADVRRALQGLLDDGVARRDARTALVHPRSVMGRRERAMAAIQRVLSLPGPGVTAG